MLYFNFSVVTCMMFIGLICCFTKVSVDPYIGDIGSKHVVVIKMFILILIFLEG